MKKFDSVRRWLFRRVVRLRGSAHDIAMGMALGAFFGLLMPPGLQLVTGLPVALLIGANLITTTLGTMVTNPFTYVPVYTFTCWVGQGFLNLFGRDVHLGHRLRELLEQIKHMQVLDVIHTLVGSVPDIAMCWVAGGIICGLAASVPAYYGTYLIVVEIHKLRERRRLHRRPPPAPAGEPGREDRPTDQTS